MKKSLNASGIKVDNFSLQEYNNKSFLVSENINDLGIFLIPSVGVPGRPQDITGYILTAATEEGKMEWTSGEQFGDVNGPLSSIDNSLVRFDGTSGKIIKDSSVIVDDIGNMNIYGTLNISNEFILGNKITLSSGNPLSDYSLTLPVSVGSAGEILKTDGLGQLYWDSSSSGGSPGGVVGSIQFNKPNGTFNGDTNLIYDDINTLLRLSRPGSDNTNLSFIPSNASVLEVRNTNSGQDAFLTVVGAINSTSNIILGSLGVTTVGTISYTNSSQTLGISNLGSGGIQLSSIGGDISMICNENIVIKNITGTLYKWPTIDATANQVLSAGSIPGTMEWRTTPNSNGNVNDIQLSDGIGGFNSATLGKFTFVDGNPISYLTLGIENGETIIKGQDAVNYNAVGSNLSIFGGSGGTDANGGQISIVTGQGGSISGDSGILTLSTHDSYTNSLTGNIILSSGNGQGGSGFVDIRTGDVSLGNNVKSGDIYIQTGNSVDNDNYSGSIFINAGYSNSGSDLVGNIFIEGSFGNNGSKGGNVTIKGGDNGDIISSYTAGDVFIKGGMGGGINKGGKVSIESGENNDVLLKAASNILLEVGSSQYTWPTIGATANQVLSAGSIPGVMEWITQPMLVYALQAISIQDGVGSNNIDALNLQFLGIPGGTLYKRSSTTALLNNIDFPNFTSSQEEYDPFGIRGDEATGDPSELNIVNKLGSGWYKISINVQHPYSNSLNIPVTNGGSNQSDQGNFCVGIKQGLTGPVPDSLDGQQVEWGFLDSSWLIPETAHYSGINKINVDPLRFIMSANTVNTETFIIRIEIVKYN